MVTKSAYGASADEVATLFADYIEGDASRPALAVSKQKLSEAAQNAIDKSLDALGYGPQACTYATFVPQIAGKGDDIELDPQALYLLIEGLDPLLLIATDRLAAEQLAQTYRAAFDLDVVTRLQGRSAAVFENLDALLATPQGKRQIWTLLKSLPD